MINRSCRLVLWSLLSTHPSVAINSVVVNRFIYTHTLTLFLLDYIVYISSVKGGGRNQEFVKSGNELGIKGFQSHELVS